MENRAKNERIGYAELCDTLSRLDSEQPALKLYHIGESLLSRPIPCVVIGSGRLCVYAGGFAGCDSITSRLLLAFAEDYAAAVGRGGRIYNVDGSYLRARRAVCVIPMVNPDGAELSLYGAGEDNPLRTRLLAANGGEDFSLWRGNGRGAELSRNFEGAFSRSPEGRGGEYPESEPESAALCNFMRMNGGASPVATISCGGSFVRYGAQSPRSRSFARILARLCGGSAEESGETCGFALWAGAEWRRPAYDIGIGGDESCAAAYARLRELLFTAPVLC